MRFLLLLLAGCDGFSFCTQTSTTEATVYTYDAQGYTLGLDSLRWDTLDEGGEAICDSTSGDGSCSTWIVEDPPEGEISFTGTRNGVESVATAEFSFSDDCPPEVETLDVEFRFGDDTSSSYY